MKVYYVYILSNKTGTLYTGVTNDLERRMYEHKNHLVKGFTSKYNIHRLIYYEEINDIEVAILREKEIKKWRRKKKLGLVRTSNPGFDDLSHTWFEES